MKHNGNYLEFEHERNCELMRAYHDDIASCKRIYLDEVWQRVANSPASRFWVSEERAAIVVARIMRGDRLEKMRPLKREMFFEIYRRVCLLLKQHADMTIYQCCINVVNSPAPKFYMTPLSVRTTIYKIKRQWYEKRKKKYRHLF